MSCPIGLSKNCVRRATLRKRGVKTTDRTKAIMKRIQTSFRGALRKQRPRVERAGVVMEPHHNRRKGKKSPSKPIFTTEYTEFTELIFQTINNRHNQSFLIDPRQLLRHKKRASVGQTEAPGGSNWFGSGFVVESIDWPVPHFL